MKRSFLLTLAVCVLTIGVLVFAGAPGLAQLPNSTTYHVALLRRGPKWTPEVTPETKRIQSEHMAHIGKLAESGLLVGAGPFLDNGVLRGIFIFKVDSLEQAKALSESDPAVKAGRLAVELRAWFGPKGIGEKYAAEKKKNPQSADQMASYQFALFTKGPKQAATPNEEGNKIMAAHFARVKELNSSGKLPAAGPFADAGEPGGIFIFDVGSLDQARALAEADPLVKAGILGVELHPWMAAKGVLP